MKISQDELKEIIYQHGLWIKDQTKGKNADLREADLREADLRWADLRGADLDYSCWPLWCGSLSANIDDRIAIQLLYHTLKASLDSPYVSNRVKEILSKDELVGLANEFHRVDECGKIIAVK